MALFSLEYLMAELLTPNLIIAGVTKAGTTSLFTYLCDHPNVRGSNIKEINHFSPVRFGKPAPPLDNYHQYFASCGSQTYRLEASPAYFYGGRPLAQAIREALPGAKIIVLFRDPLTRCISFFNFHKNMLHLPEDMSIMEYIQTCQNFSRSDFKEEKNYIYFGLHSGIYSDFLGDWLEVFGGDIGLFFFETLLEQSDHFLQEICQWLLLDKGFYDEYNFSVENKTRAYRSRLLHKCALKMNSRLESFLRKNIRVKRIVRFFYFAINGHKDEGNVDPLALSFLEEFYHPHNAALRDILTNFDINKQLPYWLKE